MVAYYNDFEPYVCEWLRNLIKAGLIPDGDVDNRSIRDVRPEDLRGYTQCHFFAGLGGWAYALRLAGWSDDRPVWTGSCPCQPFSEANVQGEGAKGFQDDRHLLPDFIRLIGECRPTTVFGEQVKGAIKFGWLDLAFRELEALDYACAAAVVPAIAAGARHERKRLYWVADASSARRRGREPVERFPLGSQAPLAVNGDTAARARRALDGDFSDLLPIDGVSVAMERCAVRGYGNAIFPPLAAEFVRASVDG